MNWGRLKELVTRNWREKIISLVLAFLFWFMIKAQDARHPASYAPQAMKNAPQTFSPPPQLVPTVQPSPEVPAKILPALPSTPAVEPPVPDLKPGAGAVKPTGL